MFAVYVHWVKRSGRVSIRCLHFPVQRSILSVVHMWLDGMINTLATSNFVHLEARWPSYYVQNLCLKAGSLLVASFFRWSVSHASRATAPPGCVQTAVASDAPSISLLGGCRGSYTPTVQPEPVE